MRSDDADEECLLVVSDECPNVVNFDPRQTTDKDLRSALRLSFTTLGRITLSHASKPQLKTGRWFIGVFLKDPRHNPNRPVMKTVEVSLDFAGGTEHLQILFLFMLSLLSLLIAVYAHVFLNPDPKDRLAVWCISSNCKSKSTLSGNADRGGARNKTLPDSNGSSESPLNSAETEYIHESTFAYTTLIAGFSLVTGAAQFIILNWKNMIDSGNRDICYYNDFCYRATITHDIPLNLMISNIVYVVHGIVLFLSILLRQYYTSKTTNDNTTNGNTTKTIRPMVIRPKQYDQWQYDQNNTTKTIRPMVIRPKQYDQWQYDQNNTTNGNTTKTIRPMAIRPKQYDQNNTTNGNTTNGNTTNGNTKRSYSIAYAFSWALIFEGIFSSLYHLCPSRMTFQFDSAFMFVMCGLVVAAVFNFRAKAQPAAPSTEAQQAAPSTEAQQAAPSTEAQPDDNAVGLHTEVQPGAPSTEAQPDGSAVSSLMRASKLFLFFISPLLIINYLGSIHDTDGFQLFPLKYLFYALVLVWILSMFIWAVWVWCWLYILFTVVVGIVWHFTVFLGGNWSNFFLFSCLLAAGLTVFGFCLTKCLPKICLRKISYQCVLQCLTVCLACLCECLHKISCQCVSQCPRKCWRKINRQCLYKWIFIAIYIGVLAACWGIALHFFLRKEVTDKVRLPSRSRELNKECVFFEYYDYHDLWHIFSSFALLETVYLILWITG